MKQHRRLGTSTTSFKNLFVSILQTMSNLRLHVLSNFTCACKLLCRTDRYCKKTTAVNGVIIPEGAAIIISIYVLHHLSLIHI